MRKILTFATVLLLVISTQAGAQTGPGLELSAGVERITYSYRFHNDSSFDTPFLVPHFFEQRYERTAPVFGARARYVAASRRLATSVSFSPEGEAFGSDFDTFFQSDGDRAVSGTAGGVDLMSLRVDQTIGVLTRTAFTIDMTLSWRRDRAGFHPADRVVTHTNPPSETHEFITDRERTVSQTFEVGVEGTLREPLGERWMLEARARLVPAVRARLLIQLPDKYPGRDIVFTAIAWSGVGTVSVTRPMGRAAATAWVSIEQAGAYRQRARFERDAVSAGGSIAFGSRH
jgi:hypothetical protein